MLEIASTSLSGSHGGSRLNFRGMSRGEQHPRPATPPTPSPRSLSWPWPRAFTCRKVLRFAAIAARKRRHGCLRREWDERLKVPKS
jgi:hypothetical protein